jgi:GTP diphosphokinase / guanosine-3',5'-bis(diphosphate) 3'-diphosphatase
MVTERALGPNVENRDTFEARLGIFQGEAREQILFAYDIAKNAHRNQLRDSGQRYFEHPRAATLILLDECKIDDPDLIVAALLHDTVEDTSIFGRRKNVPYSKWINRAHWRLSRVFNERVADMIVDLTVPMVENDEIKNKKEAKKRYLEGLLTSSPETLLVKMADRLHNLRTLNDRLPEDRIKVIKETEEIYFPIFERAMDRFPGETGLMLSEMTKVIELVRIKLDEVEQHEDEE